MIPVSLIGAGNMAWHLGHAFRNADIIIQHIWSRDSTHSRILADELGALQLFDILDLPDVPSLAIIAVPDHALPEIVQTLIRKVWQNTVFAHTSGGTSMALFPPEKMRAGVFYPLQTLTKGHPVEFDQVPILLSANAKDVEELLVNFANKISKFVQIIPDDDRLYVHMAAVIVNNFVNHLGGMAQDILLARDLDKHILEALAKETIRKMMTFDPGEVQTGPAVRGDVETIRRHLKLLASHPKMAAMYRQLSLSINPALKI